MVSIPNGTRTVWYQPCQPPMGWGGGRGAEGWGGEGFPAVPPWPPGAAPLTAAGGRPGGSGPRGPAADRGSVLFPRLPLTLGCRTLSQALARVFCSPCRRRAVPAGTGGGGGGPVCAGGGGPGQRSAVSGLPGSGPPLVLGAPVFPPSGGGARLSAALYRRGAVGRGARPPRGGRPAALSHAPPPPPRAHRLG